ncbi:MAG: DUF3572 domain-containing protein [Pseudomonadota bacterium]
MYSATISREYAEEIAIAALVWLAGNEERLSRFLSLTGLAPGELRQHATDPAFQAGVLAHLTSHEPSLLSFCEMAVVGDKTVRPADVVAAQDILGGSSAYDRSI